MSEQQEAKENTRQWLSARAYAYAHDDRALEVDDAGAFADFFTRTVMSRLGIAVVFEEWKRDQGVETTGRPEETEPTQWMVCPVPDCKGWLEVSEENPDATQTWMIQHLHRTHADYDREKAFELLKDAQLVDTQPSEGKNLYLW